MAALEASPLLLVSSSGPCAMMHDDIPKELDLVLLELRFIQLEVKMEFPKLLEDRFHVVVMFVQDLGVESIQS